MRFQTRLNVSRSHRLLGMFTTVPIVAWILSSFVLHGVGLMLPNGLQGVYELEPYHDGAASLEDETLASPSSLFETLAEDGLERLYWLRLELLGERPAYVVKPGPFELERTYDARTLERLDPLPDEMLRAVIDE